MNNSDKLKNLYAKLDMYEELKKKIGYDEELLIKPDALSEEMYNSKIRNNLPQISQRRLFNNNYLKECIRQIKLKIAKLELS